MKVNLNQLATIIHENAKKKGFYEINQFQPIINIPERLMLIVSELGEAMEAYRNNYNSDWEGYNNLIKKRIENENGAFERLIKDTFEDEIADTIIRILDLCAYLNIDIKKHIELKMRYNSTRPYKHGKKC